MPVQIAAKLKRGLYLVLGLVAVGLGGLGTVVPGLPTTVFFIIAAFAFSKSSKRLENWVLGLPVIGQLVQDNRDGLGMPRKAKILAISCIAIAIGLSAGLAIEKLEIRLLVVSVGLVGIVYIAWRVPTRETVLARRATANVLVP